MVTGAAIDWTKWQATHSPVLAEDFEFYDLDASFVLSSNHDREDPPYDAVIRDMRGEPVPSVMLTLPTPEIPASPLFRPQSLLAVPELVAASAHSNVSYLSPCAFDTPSPGPRCSFEKQSQRSDDILETDLQDAFDRHEDSGRQLNVIVESPRSLGFGAGAGLGVVLAGDENGQEDQSLIDTASAMDLRIGDNDAITGRATKLSLEKPTATTQPRSLLTLWMRLRKLFHLPLRRTTSPLGLRRRRTFLSLGDSR
jgi:hypothetical protein